MKKVNVYERGFSLFELLVTISIIGILMAVAMVSYSSAQKKARDNRRIQDMSAVQKAAEQYYAANNYLYPNWEATTNKPWTTPSGEVILDRWPTDPKNSGGFVYYFNSSGTTYCFCAPLEENTRGNYAINCSTGISHYCVKNQQ